MATQLQLRRGNTTSSQTFTGAMGEVTVNTQTHELTVHDGATVGGHKIPTKEWVEQQLENIPSSSIYFTPSVDTDGNLSWTNNGDLENPTTRNIKGQQGLQGPQGLQGQRGPQGPSGVTGYTTNCITEIPQNIKLDLNSGTLTLKEGSTINTPNGIEYIPDSSSWSTPTHNSFMGNTDWLSIIHDGTKFLAFGNKGSIATSTDGKIWTLSNVDLGEYDWEAACFGNNKIVVFGHTSRIDDEYKHYVAISSDGGNTWTKQNNPLNMTAYNHCYSAIYDGTQFIALCDNGKISTSADGITWSALTQKLNSSYSWYSIAYDGTNIAAASKTGQISISSDGCDTWTTPTQIGGMPSSSYFSITFDGTNFVVFTSAGYVSISSDGGTTWSTPTQHVEAARWNRLVYGNSKLVAINIDGYVISSNDGGSNWLTLVTGTLGDYGTSWYSLACNGTKTLAMGYNGYVSETYDEGVTWTKPKQRSGLYSNHNTWDGLASDGNSTFVGLNKNGYVTVSTDNGKTWSVSTGYAASTSGGGGGWVGLTYDGTQFVGIGNSGGIATSATGQGSWTVTRPTSHVGIKSIYYDGSKYLVVVSLTNAYSEILSFNNIADTQYTIVKNFSGNGYDLNSIAHNGNNLYVVLGSTGYVSISSDGGVTWSTPTLDTLLSKYNWKSLVFDGTQFIAMTEKGIIATTTDGVNWTISNQNSKLVCSGNLKIAYDGTKFVALNGYGNISTSTDGTTWSSPIKIANLSVNNYTSFVDSWQDWRSIIYDGEKFFALMKNSGGNYYVSTSIDGLNWSQFKQANLGQNVGIIHEVVSDGTKLVTLCSNGYAAISVDNGDTWVTYQDENLATQIYAITYSSRGKFLAITEDGYVYSSTNGITWEKAQDVNLDDHTWRTVIYCSEKFIAIGTDGYISTSSDGIIWTTPEQNTNIGSMAWIDIVQDQTKLTLFSARGYISTTTNSAEIPAFLDATISEAVDYSFGTDSGIYMLFDDGSYFEIAKCVSGATDSLFEQDAHVWYDIDNNFIKTYEASTSTPTSTVGFPVAIVTINSGMVENINQIFNGYGFIGSTVYILPGVTGLIPNGRETYANVNNISFLILNTETNTNTSSETEDVLITIDGSHIYFDSEIDYNILLNKNISNGSTVRRIVIAKAKTTSGKITDFKPRTTLLIPDTYDIMEQISAL